jgi:hypothetical protein
VTILGDRLTLQNLDAGYWAEYSLMRVKQQTYRFRFSLCTQIMDVQRTVFFCGFSHIRSREPYRVYDILLTTFFVLSRDADQYYAC